jgi:hypothetical protein
LYVSIDVFEIIQILARCNGQKQIFSKIQQTQKKAILNNSSLTKAKRGFGPKFVLRGLKGLTIDVHWLENVLSLL